MEKLKLIKVNDYVYINPDCITAIDVDLKRVLVGGKEYHYNDHFNDYLYTLGINKKENFPTSLDEVGI